MELVQNPSSNAEKKRDNVLRCLIEYIGENQADIICDHETSGETEDLGSYSLMIYVCQDTYGIVIDGQPIVKGLTTLANVFCLLVGFIYALDLEYPTKVKYTFEVFQRLFIGLNPLRPKPSNKYTGFIKKLT